MLQTEQLSDSELFEQLNAEKEVSELAFQELYARHSPRIYAYCLRFLGDKDKANDIFQDTFMKFYQSAYKGRLMTNVPAFLLRIARNLCLNSQKSEKHLVEYNDNIFVAQNSSNAENEELLDLIKKAIHKLPPEYREVFILREYEGLSYGEIAEITSETLSTIKIRIYRAKQKIREHLAPYLAELSEF